MNVSEIKEYQYFTGGQWRPAESKKLFSFATFQHLVAATIEQAVAWMYLPKGEVLETNMPGSQISFGLTRTAASANTRSEPQ
jgi:hypothetical protein